MWIPGWLDQLRQDARDAFRYVRRNPAFSFAIVLTLALGIGLTTAIYSVVNAGPAASARVRSIPSAWSG